MWILSIFDLPENGVFASALKCEPLETFCLPVTVVTVVVSSTSIGIDSILVPREIICGGVVVGLSKEITCVLVVDFVAVWLLVQIGLESTSCRGDSFFSTEF